MFFSQSPVQASSWQGKFLVFTLRFLYGIVALFKSKAWSAPLENFEENPAYFTKKDIIYLGYKYYFCPPYRFSEKIVDHFRNQNLDFSPPEGFVSQAKITISAGGDLMPYSRITKKNCEYLWDEVGDFFFGADIVFANLETAVSPSQPVSLVPEVMLSEMLFNASHEMFDIFNGNGKFKGYDILSTANNHSFDMGETGICETINFLKVKQIAHTGTATSAEERNNFPILERQGIKTAFLAYTYSLNEFVLVPDKKFIVNHLRINKLETDISLLATDVKSARNRGADFVILALHTGNAYQAFPSEHTIEMFHRIFRETGVDMILGGHPHNPQPMEKFTFICPLENIEKQGFAIYCLPDFVAYDIFLWDRLIPLLKLTLEKGKIGQEIKTLLTKVEVLPVYNWGSKNLKKSREIRFLDLKKTLSLIQTGQKPEFMTKKCVKELLYLNHFYENFFLCKNEAIT